MLSIELLSRRGEIMRRFLVPLVFMLLVVTAGTLGMVFPASADESAKPYHTEDECPYSI
jgi:hypothetical protein